MWQLRIVYLCWKFVLGFHYCMLSDRAFASDKGFFMTDLSWDHVCNTAHSIWRLFNLSFLAGYQIMSDSCNWKVKSSGSVLHLWGRISPHLQQRVAFRWRIWAYVTRVRSALVWMLWAQWEICFKTYWSITIKTKTEMRLAYGLVVSIDCLFKQI